MDTQPADADGVAARQGAKADVLGDATFLRAAAFAKGFALHGGETREEPARYAAGDALVTGALGESWCTPRAYFDAHYEPVAPTAAGQDGTYTKRRQEVLAFELRAPRRIPLSQDRGLLSGNAGDWVVDYGGGNLAIVARELFPRYFTLDPGAR